jgi:hypothetical protein
MLISASNVRVDLIIKAELNNYKFGIYLGINFWIYLSDNIVHIFINKFCNYKLFKLYIFNKF